MKKNVEKNLRRFIKELSFLITTMGLFTVLLGIILLVYKYALDDTGKFYLDCKETAIANILSGFILLVVKWISIIIIKINAPSKRYYKKNKMERRNEILKEIKKMRDIEIKGGIHATEIHSRVIGLSFQYSTAEIAGRYLRKKGYKVSIKSKINLGCLPYLETEGIRIASIFVG